MGEFPTVVRLDGIWITVMFPTGQTQRDRLGTLGAVKRAKKVPILAAQGVWPLTGKTTLLAWTRAESEDKINWQKFLEQLYEARITPENGLLLLVADGCKLASRIREHLLDNPAPTMCVPQAAQHGSSFAHSRRP